MDNRKIKTIFKKGKLDICEIPVWIGDKIFFGCEITYKKITKRFYIPIEEMGLKK